MQYIEQRTSLLLRILFSTSVVVCAFIIGYLVLQGDALPAEWLWLTIAAVFALLVSVWFEVQRFQYALVVQFWLAIALWGVIIAKLGGAMSSANALQLILVALIYLALPLRQALLTSVPLLAFQFYYMGSLLLGPNTHEQHAHYAGMSISFLLASFILAVVIYLLKHALADQQKELAGLREEQLRQEQVIALATATVQMTHELATPLNTLSLWVDEIAETDEAPQSRLTELTPPLQHMKTILNQLRQTTQSIYHEQIETFEIAFIQQNLKSQLSLQFPEIQVYWLGECNKRKVSADYSLLPALLNLIRNAIEYTTAKDVRVEVHSWVDSSKTPERWMLTIENEVEIFPETLLQQLGKTAVQSGQGLGIGTLLSHATLERFGGSLTVQYKQPLLKQTVSLPTE